MPGQNPVQITATSVANSKVAGSTFANLLTPGPTISSVSRNPLPVGTFNVTVQGSGFQSGAMVYDTSGSNSFVQLTTTIRHFYKPSRQLATRGTPVPRHSP